MQMIDSQMLGAVDLDEPDLVVGVAWCMGTVRVDSFALGGRRRLPWAEGFAGVGVWRRCIAWSVCIATTCKLRFIGVPFGYLDVIMRLRRMHVDMP